MGAALTQFGLNTAGQAIGAGMGLLLGKANDKRQLEQQRKLQEMQIQGNKELADYNQWKQMQNWKATNYPAQMEQIKAAGLNPAMIYGMGGAGGATTGGGSQSVSGGNAPTGGGEAQAMAGMGLQSAMNLKLMQAQKENIEADTANKQAVTTKTAGPDTANINADTENKILESVIKDYTGKDAKLTFERIKKPNIGVESETNLKEMEARQGIAHTIYELWRDGQLANKANAEIEQILLKNAKTRGETQNILKTFDLLEENIKGAKLDNIMRELESKLQTETGIDKNSPAWMKILGRLFIGLTNQ